MQKCLEVLEILYRIAIESLREAQLVRGSVDIFDFINSTHSMKVVI